MRKILFYLALLSVSGLIFQGAVEAQEVLKKLFPGKKILAEKSFDQPVSKAFTSSDKIAVLTEARPGGDGKVTLFDIEGRVLWQKSFNWVGNVSLADESDRIVVAYDYNLRDERRNACFDKEGNKLWEVWVTDPGLTISKDGKYGITTRVSMEEAAGHFQVFDLANGQEILHPTKKDYSCFHACFLDENRVVVLLQKAVYDEDKKTATRKPLTFIIFNIANNKVEVEKEIYSKISGKEIWVSAFDAASVTALNKNRITVAAYNLPFEEKIAQYPYTLIMFDSKGNVLWENDSFKIIKNIKLINDNRLIVLGKKNISLVDVSTGRKLWSYTHTKRGSHRIQEAYIDGNKLVIQTNVRFEISAIHILDLDTGEDLSEDKNLDDWIIVKSFNNNNVLFNKTANRISFFGQN
ncbi:PQQ-binding-like beta-propeller repeat protein [candidate division KSB1 bacterium]|nr:PQQ-binding-like beta-propeller repeat protein [candidate division KSB1 bacterium]